MAMFIRVKRKKTTYFLHCDPTETILEIKQKIQALSENPVDCQRLILMSTQQILDDNKTLADQKTLQTKALGEPEASEADKNDKGFQGVLLQDAKTLAEQQVQGFQAIAAKVENDAIVALCLKISDPRTHRIPTLMRHPILLPTRSPTPTPPEVVEEIILAPGEEPPPPPPPPPPEHRMSTELRVPYRPPKEEIDTEDVGKEGSVASKDTSQKDTIKKETQKEGLKKEVKKEIAKKEVKKETATKDVSKKEVSKKEADKKLGKETPGKGGKQSSKKGGKKGPKEEVPPPPEESVGPPNDGGVWEDITIDKLTDYSSLVDSD